MKNILLLTTASMIILGCSTTSTTIIPNSDGTYTMNATDRTGPAALDGGIKAATKTCKEQGKYLAVISHRTRYNGGFLDHSTKEAINNISMMKQERRGEAPMPFMNTNQDYTVAIKYKCISQ
ncbi:MAG: hypothetical protein ACK5Z5_07745 [Neisseriaceae bacterium]|jgi:hypothetical protein